MLRTSLTIALIDKYPLILKGLEGTLLENDSNLIVITAQTFENFILFNKGIIPDIFVLGINETCQQQNIQAFHDVKKNYPSSLLILMDDVVQPEMGIAFLKSGVDGYILKQDEIMELNICVQSILKGNRYVSRMLLDILLQFLYKNRIAKKQPHLSKCQQEVVQLLRAGQSPLSITRTLNVSFKIINSTILKTGSLLGIMNVFN